MTRATAYPPIFPPPRELPRGPHTLTRAEVARVQRERLMAAIARVVAQRGYAAATITETARAAGVSPKTFYEHFADKLDCFLAAYDAMAGELLARIGTALQETDEWDTFVHAALGAYLGTLEGDPDVARAFLVEIDGAGRAARERRRAAYTGFAALIRERHERMRAADPSIPALPDRAYLGLVHGVRALVCDALDTQHAPRLTALEDDIAAWLRATVT